MSFGFSYNNDAGKVSIDSDHINMAVLQRGQFGTYLPASQQFTDNRHGVRVQVRYPAAVGTNVAPIVAFVPRRNCNGHWHAFQHTGGPGNWTGFDVSFMERYPGELVNYYYNWVAPTSLPYWDWVVASSEGNRYSNEYFGLRIWDELGNLAFDSGTPVMKILNVISGWNPVGNYPQWRSYVSPWAFTANGQYGFIASNLPMQAINTSYSPFVSVRFGFTAAGLAANQIMCTVGGADANSEEGIYALISSSMLSDEVLNKWLALNPIQLLVVRVQ